MRKPDQDTKAVDAKAVNGAARSGRKRRRWSAEEKIRITREMFCLERVGDGGGGSVRNRAQSA